MQESRISRTINASQWMVLTGIILGIYFEIILVIVVVLLIWKDKAKISIPFKPTLILILILSISILNIILNSYSFTKFIQQCLLISVAIIGYAVFFSYNKNHLDSLFYKYMTIMHFICILGLLQFVICLIFQVDIFPFTLDGYIQNPPSHRIMRIHSILAEAGNLGTILTPAIVTIICKDNYFKKNKRQSIIIFTTFFLTLATISFAILALVLIYHLYQKFNFLRYIYLFSLIIIVPIAFGAMKSNIEVATGLDNQDFFNVIQYKLVQSTSIFESNDIDDYESLNASSFAALSNFWVAKNAPSRVIGTGLGTHEESYQRVYPNTNYYLHGLNSQDGYSLFNRIFSEFGFIGIFIYILFILKNTNNKNIINLSCIFYIITIFLRGGHYTQYGVVFFHFILIYSSKRKEK